MGIFNSAPIDLDLRNRSRAMVIKATAHSPLKILRYSNQKKADIGIIFKSKTLRDIPNKLRLVDFTVSKALRSEYTARILLDIMETSYDSYV